MCRWILSLLLGLSLLPVTAAAGSADWETLKHCQLMPNSANDGDSFHVKCKNREYIFRLYFVDAPETDDSIAERVTEQATYFRLSKQQTLRVGGTAKQFTATKLSQSFEVITRWQDAMGRSHLPRYYAVVRYGGHDLGEALVENGLARIHGERANLPDGTSTVGEETKLRSLKRQAQAVRRGAWSRSSNAPADPPRLGPIPTVSQTNIASESQAEEYRISASGLRHNSRCRYFNVSGTRSCGPDDGRPCRICGG